MHYEYTNRSGFLLGFIDFFTAGLFFLLYMPLGGLQDEIESVPRSQGDALLESLLARYTYAVHLYAGLDGPNS